MVKTSVPSGCWDLRYSVINKYRSSGQPVCHWLYEANTGGNSRWHSGQYRVYIYIDRVGHFTLDLSLIPGKSYKLRTSETYDVIGHDLFMYDIYLNYTFG